MVCTRSKTTLNKIPESSRTTNIFDHLISTLESSQRIKSQLLKSLYNLLIELSTKRELCTSKGANLNDLCVKTNEGEVRLNLKDIYSLSVILFKDLQKRLKQLHSSTHDITASRSLELEELKLLIRCCMVILTFPLPQKHFLESGRVLLLIFKKWSLLEVAVEWHEQSDIKKSISCQCMYGDENSFDSFAKVASSSSLELCDPCIPSIAEILEVVIDELLLNVRLRKYLPFIDSFSPVRLFNLGTNSSDFGVLIEMLCSHFSLSFSNDTALREFYSRLTWVRSDKSKSLELSVVASRTLLHNPVVLSSPKLFQAHILSLVSNVISVTIKCETLTPDPKLVDCYFSVFEVSVLLYTQHMSTLDPENHSEDVTGTLVEIRNKSSQLSFESCIELSKKEKLDHTIAALNESWNSSLRNKVCKKKSDLLASSIEYIQENVRIIDFACRDEIVAFLNCMLTRAANDVNDIELPLNGCASLQDICFLASLLMLMSNSLIQSVWSLGHRCSNSLNDLSRCKEYNFIVGIINRFKDFSIRLPIKKFSYGIMETNPSSHKESRLMLLHFLGLLSFCFDSGFDFLVKSCISVIIGLTNLFVLEEGNVDALRLLVDRKTSSSDGYLIACKEALVCQSPTLAIVSKFQKIRTSYVSDTSPTNESTLTENAEIENVSTALDPLSMGSVTTSNIETCSGEIYLKTRFKQSGCVTDIDDLATFVECKKGKDYADWFKGREKFREKKLKKFRKRSWEKKKQAWRQSMRG